MGFHSFTRELPCPICGKPDWCGYSDNYIICMRVPEVAGKRKPTQSRNGGFLYFAEDFGSFKPPPVEKFVPTTDKKSAGEINIVYRALLDVLDLDERHRQDLRDRGMSAKEIEQGGYRTMPRFTRKIVEKLPFKDGDLIGIPGFALNNYGELVLCSLPGIVIPVTPDQKHIEALLIRGNKGYRWLSSKRMAYGSSPGAPVHQTGSGDPVWITEGPLKANIASVRLKKKFIAVPGISNWKRAIELTGDIVVIAYDNEYSQKRQVGRHARNLANVLLDLNKIVYVALWDDHKGIDDALVAGKNIRLLKIKTKK